MNPELQRNLWLEFSIVRLVLVPLIGAFLCIAGWRVAGMPGLAWAAQATIWLILVLWGSRLAADSVLGEVGDRTWDSQRMSSISAWSMTWGKLVGGTLAAWAGAVLFVPVLIYAWLQYGDIAYEILGQLFLAGLYSQGVALLVTLYMLRGRQQKVRFQVTVAQFLGILAGLQFGVLDQFFAVEGVVRWYGFAIEGSSFVLAVQAVFGFWLVVATHRAMRLCLQYRNQPWIWLAFLAFLIAGAWGFERPQGLRVVDLLEPTGTLGSAWTALYAVVVATYLAAFIEPKGFLRMRRCLGAWRRLDGGAIAAYTPSFVYGLLAAAGLAGICIAYAGVVPRFLPGMPELSVRWYFVAVVLFLLRDVLFLTALTLDVRFQQGTLLAVIILGFTNVMFPFLLGFQGRLEMLAVFTAFPVGSPAAVAGPVALQVLAVLVFLYVRWRALARGAPPDPTLARPATA